MSIFRNFLGPLVVFTTKRGLTRTQLGGFCSEAGGKITVGELMKKWSKRFEKEGVPEPVESIRHILASILGTKQFMNLPNEQVMDSSKLEKLETLCECRLSRMPVQYIIGEWDFRDLTLKLVPPVFIPRPETEILVDLVLKRISETQFQDEPRILEIGCGSGAISLSIAHTHNNVNCTAIDASSHACGLTMENRDQLGLGERVTVETAELDPEGTIKKYNKNSSIDFNKEKYDIIVSNPPYIPSKAIPGLAPEVRIFEDLRALDGGDDGLKVIKPLMHYASKALKQNGRLFMEVDPGHPDYIAFFTSKYTELGLRHEHTFKDYCNNERFVEISKV